MKPVAFDLLRARSIDEALRAMADAGGGAKIIAGGQSLGPMLNLRLVRPDLLIDISGIPALCEARETDDAVVFGACVTHSAIEDGRLSDPSKGFMARVARGIAYRAVRNRGTVAGSVVHADPSADWLTTLTALGASAEIEGPDGWRGADLADFVTMPFSVDLREGEFVTGIRVPRRSDRARFGYFKFCRKKGEFASAMACIVHDGDFARAVVGATGGKPRLLPEVARHLPATAASVAEAMERVREMRIADDPLADQAHAEALARAMRQVAE